VPENNEAVQTENIELKINIYNTLKNGEFEASEELTLKGMEEDLHNQDYEKILKIIKFWQNRKELFLYKENGGESLFNEWDRFLGFCRENSIDNKKAILAVKSYIYSRLIELLIDAYRLSPVPERETLILLGQAFYEVGMVEKAIETLEYAMSIVLDDEDVRIYTMLGNLYTETGENELAMVMYNDAFFKFPQLINLDIIDFPPIHKLREMVKEDGFNDNEVLEWIPVYGYFYEGLTVKRKMEYKDYMELKEKIIDYEKTLKVDKKAIPIIIPRLVNYYLWVLDYYLYQVNTKGPAENVVKRILFLIDSAPLGGTVKEKLTGRAGLMFKNIMENKTADKEEPK
jgi:tetratricopeptide (TPR) repeat protein